MKGGLLKKIVAIITGRDVKDEATKMQETISEARRIVRDTRAMLNGEDSWLIPPGRKSCNGK
jgi:hypothetical protein